MADSGVARLRVGRATPGIIIPGYVYPGAAPRAVWDAWIAAADPVQWIIANPGSPGGPGTFTDANYAAVIAQAQARGIEIFGYVDTSYALPDISTPTIDNFNATPNQSVWLRTGFFNGPQFSGESAPVTDAVPTYASCPTSGTIYSVATAAQLSVDQEVRIVLGSVVNDFQLWTRLTSTSAYYAEILASGAISISTAVSSVPLGTTLVRGTLLASGTHVPVAGEEYAFRSSVDQHQLLYKPVGGSWTPLLTVTDATYRQTGYGCWRMWGPQRIDALGGGVSGTLIKQQVDTWFSLYGIRDIFFDQTASGPNDLGFYQSLANFVRARSGSARVMMNPGTTADQGYMAAADILCVFEGTETTYASYVPSAWNAGYSRNRFCHLVYNAATAASMSADIDQAVSQNAGFVDVVDSAVWFAQSALFDAQIAKLRASGGRISASGTATFSFPRSVSSGALGQSYLGQRYVGYAAAFPLVTEGETLVDSGSATIGITQASIANIISESAVCSLTVSLIGVEPEVSVTTMAVSASASEVIVDPGDIVLVALGPVGVDAFSESPTQTVAILTATVSEHLQAADTATLVVAESDVDLESDAGTVTFSVTPIASVATTDAGLQLATFPYWLVTGALGQSYIGRGYVGQANAQIHGLEAITDAGTCTFSVTLAATETISDTGSSLVALIATAVGFDNGLANVALVTATVTELVSDAGTALFGVVSDGMIGGTTSFSISPSAVTYGAELGTCVFGISAGLYEAIAELVIPDTPPSSIVTGAVGQSYIGQNYVGESIQVVPGIVVPSHAALIGVSVTAIAGVVSASGTVSFQIAPYLVPALVSPGDAVAPGDVATPMVNAPGYETIIDQATVALVVSEAAVTTVLLGDVGTCLFDIATNVVQAVVVQSVVADSGTVVIALDGVADEYVTDGGAATLVVTPSFQFGGSGIATITIVSITGVIQTQVVGIAAFAISGIAVWTSGGPLGGSPVTSDAGRRARIRAQRARVHARKTQNPWRRDRSLR